MSKMLNINIDIYFLAVISSWQTAKTIAKQKINAITNSVQEIGSSLQETAATKTDIAIDKLTNTIEQAKYSLEQAWQTAEQTQNTTSGAINQVIASYVNNFITQYPIFLRSWQILAWTINHPIIGLVFLLISIALIWSIIKAIIRLIETASWSIIQIPLKLIKAAIQFVFIFFTQLVKLAIQQSSAVKTNTNLELLPTNSQIIYQDKQQRLSEIVNRLEAIQQEQQELLQEAANLMANEKFDWKDQEIKIKNQNFN